MPEYNDSTYACGRFREDEKMEAKVVFVMFSHERAEIPEFNMM